MSDKQDTIHEAGEQNNNTSTTNITASNLQPAEEESKREPIANSVHTAEVTAQNAEQTTSISKEPSAQNHEKVIPQKVDDTQTEESTQDTAKDESEKVPEKSAWGALFSGLAKLGPIMLLVALCLMAWPDFWYAGNAVYCPGEKASVSAFLHCLAQNSWIAPSSLDTSGAAVPQWPVFFWLIALLALIPGIIDSGQLLPLASCISAALALVAVWWLAHTARFGYQAAFASGLILLSAPLFAPMPHFMGPFCLAAALLIFSLVFFCHGWLAKRAFFSLPFGFIFAGLAGLCGGPLFLILPLLASLIFLIWRGNLGRAQSLDALAGFILLLALIGAWLAAIMLGDYDNSYLRDLFDQSWRITWPPLNWQFPLLISAIGSLPWLLMIFGVSWIRVLGNSPKTLSASRKTNGSALVWISLVFACCMALFTVRPQFAAVTIVCLLAVLLGKAFINLSPIGNRFFFLLASLCLIIVGAIILCASFSFSQELLLKIIPFQIDEKIPQILLNLKSLPVMGGIVLVGGLLGLFFVGGNREGGGLIYSVILVIILCQPAHLMLVPELASNLPNRLESMPVLEQQFKAASTISTLPIPVETQAVPNPAPASVLPQQNNAPSVDMPQLNIPPSESAPESTVEPEVKEPAETPPALSEQPTQETLPQAGTQPSAVNSQPLKEVEQVIIVPDINKALEDAAANVTPSAQPEATQTTEPNN